MIFQKDQNHATALRSLTPTQRVAFSVLTTGGIFPVFFIGVVRPVFWLIAAQLACITGIAYLRWKSPSFRGSFIVLCLASIACLVSVVAAAAA